MRLVCRSPKISKLLAFIEIRPIKVSMQEGRNLELVLHIGKNMFNT
jgi:hypothetical protein